MNNKLQSFELSSLLFFIMRASYIGIGIQIYFEYAKVNAYLAPIIGTIIGVIPLLIFLGISKYKEEFNILEINDHLFGKTIGKIINLILMITVFSLTVILYYDLVNFITSESLYETPPLAISIIVLIPIIYLLCKGLKVICKTSIILFFISLGLFILSFFGLVTQVKFGNIQPFLEHGINGTMKASIIHIAYSILPLFILTIIPRNEIYDKEKLTKKMIFNYFFVNILIILGTFIILSVAGIDLALLYQYPDYHILRRISIGGIIQRIENFLSIQWLISICICLTINCYYIIKSFKHIFNIEQERKLNFVIPIIIMGLSTIIFINNIVAFNFLMNVFPTILFAFLFGIPLIIRIMIKKEMNKSFHNIKY